MSRLDNFVANALKSGLVLPPDLEQARSRLTPGPDTEATAQLARLLIDQGTLTRYQANKLLSGATRGFFLGGYRIQRPLGHGGMGKVYLASRESDGQQVAIKVLPPKKALEEAEALARFKREMDLSRRVQHPNLARTLEVGDDDGVHFMVMEYVPGHSLYHLVRSHAGGPLRVHDAARYFLKVVEGLNAVHAHGMIHRDIKPSNLMVTPDGDAKILDLGLAWNLGEQAALSAQNLVVGTLDYASPEQLGDAARADRRSDLYSLGCTLYFALSGRPPFEGGDVVNKIFKHRMEEPPRLETVARGVPAAFAAIVRKLMAKEPADRYQTGQELQTDLARWTDPGRSFHPPQDDLDDAEEVDLEVVPDDGTASSPLSASLRALAELEPDNTSSKAVAGGSAATGSEIHLGPRVRGSSNSRQLIRFLIVAVVAGTLAILGIALVRAL